MANGKGRTGTDTILKSLTMRRSKNVFYVGDKVRLIDPRLILKIGYEKDIDSMLEAATQDERVIVFCREMKLNPRQRGEIIRTIARSMVPLREGSKRSITFSDPDENLRGKEFFVASKHVRYTGVYSRASGGYSYDGEYDYEPAALRNAEAHIVLELSRYEPLGLRLAFRDYSDSLYVTSEQIEKV